VSVVAVVAGLLRAQIAFIFFFPTGLKFPPTIAGPSLKRAAHQGKARLSARRCNGFYSTELSAGALAFQAFRLELEVVPRLFAAEKGSLDASSKNA
jgi:hypothetical protein